MIITLSSSVSPAWDQGTIGFAFGGALMSGSILVQGSVDCCCRGGHVGADLGGALIQCGSAVGLRLCKHHGGDFGLIGGGPFGSSNLGGGRSGGGGGCSSDL